MVLSDEYKKACEDPNIDTVGSVCDIIVGSRMFNGFARDHEKWTLDIPDDIQKAVEDANVPLQEVIDKLK